MKEYSFAKGLWKGIKAILTALLVFLAFAGFSDISLWDLLVTYVKPLIGSLTLGGAITVALNYVKIQQEIAGEL